MTNVGASRVISVLLGILCRISATDKSIQSVVTHSLVTVSSLDGKQNPANPANVLAAYDYYLRYIFTKKKRRKGQSECKGTLIEDCDTSI